MVTRSFRIKAPQGLHARPCANLAAAARDFASDVSMCYNGEEYDATNPIALMSAGVSYDDEIIFKISGNDEEEAIEAIAIILENE